MSDTFSSREIGEIFAGGDPKREESIGIGSGESIYPGFGIYVTAGLGYAAKNSDKRFSGIADIIMGNDLDTVMTSTEHFEYFATGQDTDVWAYWAAVSPAVSCEKGDKIVLSATDGMMTIFAYADSTDTTDSFINYAGHAVDAVTGSTTATKLFRLHLS